MSYLNNLSRIANEFLYSMGRRSYAEYFIKQLPPEDQEEGRYYLTQLTNTKEAANPASYFRVLQDFTGFISKCQTKDVGKEVKKAYLFANPQDTGYFGTRPQGSKIWTFFPNPFGVFAYVAEQYWAVTRCINLVRETVEADGFALKADEGVSEETLIGYYKQLRELDIETLWVEFIAHSMLFNNFFALPHIGKRSRKLKKYEILYPPRLSPKFNNSTYEIEQYEYRIGKIRRYYSVDEVDHAMGASMFGKELGPPSLLSCITEIETALMTMSFNNNMLQKGFLISKLVSLKSEEGGDFNPSKNSDWREEVQMSLDSLHSGTKAGQGPLALTGVDGVYDITDPGAVELNFRESRPELDKRICNSLGIPSEKIGIPRSTTAQYQPSLVENVVNAQYDQTINSFTMKAARFFNKYLLQKHLGIYDAKLVPAGRYGAITLAAAQTVKELSQGGPLTTVNEARTTILGWAPLPPNDPRGNQVIDTSINRDPEAIRAQIAPEAIDPELEVEKDLGKISDGSLYISFGENSGRISKSRPVILRTQYEVQE